MNVEAVANNDGSGDHTVSRPTMIGFEIQVQRCYPEGMEAPKASDRLGRVGVGLFLAPDGTPRLILKLSHPDEEYPLAAIMDDKLFQMLAGALAMKAQEAAALQSAALSAHRNPS